MDKLKFSQFGIMSVQYQQFSLEYCLDSIAGNGFQYVDFWGGAGHYCAFDTPAGQREKRTREIRKMLDDRGLKMSVFTAEQICLYPINVASSNPYVRRNSIDIVKGYIEDTKTFGAGFFFPQMGYCMFDEDSEACVERSIEALREMADYAKQVGVEMVMEQLQPYECNICYDPATLKCLIDGVGDPVLTACIDCVAAAAGGQTPEDYYTAFEGNIKHAHIADGEPTGHLVPGDGTNPLVDYLRIFANHDFSGSITVEVNNQRYFADPDTAVGRAARWLKACPVVDATA